MRGVKAVILLGVVGTVAGAAPGCTTESGFECEGCPCGDYGACDDGLVCVNGTCKEPSGGGAGGGNESDSPGGAAGSGGSVGTSGGAAGEPVAASGGANAGGETGADAGGGDAGEGGSVASGGSAGEGGSVGSGATAGTAGGGAGAGGDPNGPHCSQGPAATTWVSQLEEEVWGFGRALSATQTPDCGYVVSGAYGTVFVREGVPNFANCTATYRTDAAGVVLWRQGSCFEMNSVTPGWITALPVDAGGTVSVMTSFFGSTPLNEVYRYSYRDDGTLRWGNVLGPDGCYCGLSAWPVTQCLAPAGGDTFMLACSDGRLFTVSPDGDLQLHTDVASSVHSIRGTGNGEFVTVGDALSVVSSDGTVSPLSTLGGNDGIRTRDGGILVVAGATVRKINAAGGSLWDQTLSEGTGDQLLSVALANADNYVLAGEWDSDLWVVLLDETGSVVWQRAWDWGYEERAYSIRQTGDGGFIVAGSFTNSDSQSTGVLVKLNADGEL